MTELLLKTFIKNREDTEDPSVRTACGRLAGIVGIICNVILFAGKLIVGTLSGSVSISADAVNNLSDASSSVVTLIGFKLASKPADDEHPYGHSRIEYFSGLAVAVLILVIGVELVKSSVQKIIHPEPVEFSIAIVIVLLGSIAVKLWMAIFNGKVGKMISSGTLIAAAADSRNDVISTAAVLLACIVGRLSGLMIDGWVGLLVAIFILWSGIGIARDTISPLLGESPDEQLVHSIAYEIKAHEIVLGVHDLIVHDYGPSRRFASAHVEVDCREDVLLAHECIDDIEREVMQKLNVELVLHYDPIVTDDEELNEMKQRVLKEIGTIDERFAMHDFRMVRGETHTNLIFDLVIPREYEGRTAELHDIIENAVQLGDKKYYAVITFDSASFNDPHMR